jgi:hypothetical protein
MQVRGRIKQLNKLFLFHPWSNLPLLSLTCLLLVVPLEGALRFQELHRNHILYIFILESESKFIPKPSLALPKVAHLHSLPKPRMELCGGSRYKPSEAIYDSSVEGLAPQPPLTPVQSNSTEDEIKTYHLHTPSPMLLNPITDEDWSATRQKISSSIRLSLTDDHAHKLISGTELSLLREGGQRPVTLHLDANQSVLRINFHQPSHKDCDEKKGDDHAAKDSNILIPVQSISSVYGFGNFLAIKLEVDFEGIVDNHYEFECESSAKKECVVEGLQALISDTNKPLTLEQRHSRLLAQRCSEFDTHLSPVSLTEDPDNEDAVSPIASPKIVRVHETAHLGISADGARAMTPADQGMELTLIDTTASRDTRETIAAPSGQGNINMPVLDTSDSNLERKIDTTSTLVQRTTSSAPQRMLEIETKESVSAVALQVSPLSDSAFMITSPWCEADLCTMGINEVTEAFADLFGGGAEECKDVEDVHCLEAALLVAEDMAVSEHAVPLPLDAAIQAAESEAIQKRSRIRNRSENVNEQAKRCRELRNKITFEAVNDSSSKKMPHIQTIHSMDELDIARNVSVPRLGQSWLYGFNGVFDQFLPATQKTPETGKHNDSYYYDSDPEDVRERKFRKVRKATADHWNNSRGPGVGRRDAVFSLPDDIIQAASLVDSDIKTVVEIMKSANLNLLWHPNPTKDNPFPTPTCVQAWIERGTYLLNQTYVQPKLMWKPVFESQLGSNRKINLKIDKIDLLEIARIDGSPKDLSRSIFPFVHKPSCFAIKTKRNYLLFQAQNAVEKAHVIYALKLAVARLASLLIVRDSAAIDEFFEPIDSSVPGAAPELHHYF